MKTDKEHIQWAWKNVPERYRLTPLMLALGDVIESLPNDNEKFKQAYLLIDDFAKRVGHGQWKPGKTTLTKGPACLDYETDWEGEWEVRNLDLEGMGLFRMWLSRIETERATAHIISPIFKAIKGKRLWQAWLRYEQSGLTQDHCAVLSKMLWEIDVFRGDGVSLYVQGKRPLGNSCIAHDIFEATGWERTWGEDDEMPDDQEERAWNLLDELPFAAPDVAKRAASTLSP